MNNHENSLTYLKIPCDNEKNMPKKGGSFVKRIKKKGTFGQNLKHLDWMTILMVCILLGTGFVTIYSITSVLIYNNHYDDPTHFVVRQGLGVILGIIGIGCIMAIPYQKIKSLSYLAFPGTLIILLITLLIGTGPNVKSWIEIGPLSLQPAEFAKIGVILAIAWFVSTQRAYFRHLSFLKMFSTLFEPISFWQKISRYLVSPWGMLAYTAANLLLVMLQPDLGTGLIIMATGILMVLCSGIRLKTVVQLLFVLSLMFGTVWNIKDSVLENHQLERFLAWENPFDYEDTIGYQNIMGYTAIAIGGLKGSGIGEGIHKYGYVVEPHNDFIITIVSEEFGCLYVLFIMGLYFAMFYRMVKSGLNSDDVFASMTCFGVAICFLTQIIINLGGVSGTIPMTGVTLPFISYGGTSVMTCFFLLGIYLKMDSHIKKENKEKLRKEFMREYEKSQNKKENFEALQKNL